MALITCKECGKEVSNQAATCLHCGAPLPRVLRPDEEECPFCRSPVQQDAHVCPNCDAMKGYATNAYGVMGRGSFIAFGIALPVIIAVVLVPFFWPGALVVAAFAGYCIYRLKRGPYWYHSK